jgi:hypothetical protein
MIAAIGGWWWLAPKVPVVHEPVSVLIADFDNRTGDPVFDGVVEQALQAPAPTQHAAFRDRIRLLVQMRNQL